jgi:hypothetical protein
LEDKGYSFAVHYRLAPQMEQTLKAKIAAIVEPPLAMAREDKRRTQYQTIPNAWERSA